MAENPRGLTVCASFTRLCIILSDFRTGVMVFRFSGPDSGQHDNWGQKLRFRKEELGYSERSVNQGLVGIWKVF